MVLTLVRTVYPIKENQNNMRKKLLAIVVALCAVALALTGCTSDGKSSAAKDANQAARQNVQQANSEFKAPDVKNFTDYNNYYKSQTLYDDPSTIIWCTTTWGNANSPLVTVPIAGKLTSSSVSLFPSTQTKDFTSDSSGTYNPELPSVDGMYHGSPPPYRYGFTPGGQYVDFSNMDVFCTTALTDFQRQSTKIDLSIDTDMAAAQKQAEAALAACNKATNKTNGSTDAAACAAAQKALQDGLGGK